VPIGAALPAAPVALALKPPTHLVWLAVHVPELAARLLQQTSASWQAALPLLQPLLLPLLVVPELLPTLVLLGPWCLPLPVRVLLLFLLFLPMLLL